MSFARLRLQPLARQARLFTTSPYRQSVLDSAKDAAKKVDRTVSDAAVKGIEKGGMSTPYQCCSSALLLLPSRAFCPVSLTPGFSLAVNVFFCPGLLTKRET